MREAGTDVTIVQWRARSESLVSAQVGAQAHLRCLCVGAVAWQIDAPACNVQVTKEEIAVVDEQWLRDTNGAERLTPVVSTP